MSAIIMHATRRYLSTTIARNAKGEVPIASAVAGGHGGGSKLWRNITIFVAFPAIVLCSVNSYLAHKRHEEHFHRPPFVKYEYLAMRTKKFPWGDGNHSLFHNPRTNALPEGYEDEH